MIKYNQKTELRNIRNFNYFLSLIFIIAFSSYSAQKNFISDADVKFDNEAYFSAIDLYKKGEVKEKDIKADVEVIYQSIDNLHKACPDDLGDWYFSGDYPTPGGNKVVNQAYINYFEGSNSRAY